MPISSSLNQRNIISGAIWLLSLIGVMALIQRVASTITAQRKSIGFFPALGNNISRA